MGAREGPPAAAHARGEGEQPVSALGAPSSPMASKPLLAGRVCIVSGVGPGLGRSIAHAFAREGAHVVVACRREPVAIEIAGELTALGARALPVAMDIAKPEDRARLVEASIAAFGGIDVLVNNA